MLAALALAGCDPAPPAPPEIKVTLNPPVYCEIYEPIAWSKADTPETVRGVLRENAKFSKTCPASKSKIAAKG